MPSGNTLSDVQGTATATYRSGLKLDGAWHPYASACPRVDVRPGDSVRLSIDAAGQVMAVEVTARGAGSLPSDTISPKQRELLEKIVDDKEGSIQDLEEGFLRKYKGKRLGDLTKKEAGSLIDFFFGGVQKRRSRNA